MDVVELQLLPAHRLIVGGHQELPEVVLGGGVRQSDDDVSPLHPVSVEGVLVRSADLDQITSANGGDDVVAHLAQLSPHVVVVGEHFGVAV